MIGDYKDVYFRLISNLPMSWFGENTPNLNTILQAYITIAQLNYAQMIYDQLQLRINNYNAQGQVLPNGVGATYGATGVNLDLISQDYFNGGLQRLQNEPDDTFRRRILSLLLQERATRSGIYNALLKLTGNPPFIFEPWNPNDCGALNWSNLYLNWMGNYGSMSYPATIWIIVNAGVYQGVSYFAGLNSFGMFLNYSNFPTLNPSGSVDFVPMSLYASSSLIYSLFSDEMIYIMVSKLVACGVKFILTINR